MNIAEWQEWISKLSDEQIDKTLRAFEMLPIKILDEFSSVGLTKVRLMIQIEKQIRQKQKKEVKK